MNLTPDPQPRQRRYSVRRQARLDAETHGKLEELARTLHRKRSAVLRSVMQWGLTHGKDWTIDRAIPASARPVNMLVEPQLLQQVQEAADMHGVTVAAWLREAVRQVTVADFPASWRADVPTSRSHDSGYYQRRFMLRLDAETSTKLEILTQTYGRSAAEVIRQLIAQARPEEFPRSWHLAVEERR